jgi:hypothetical protein
VTDALADRAWNEPHPSRLPEFRSDREAILKAHSAAVATGQPSYRDPSTGLSVLTSAYLADRGYCCGNGCRHCPYVC